MRSNGRKLIALLAVPLTMWLAISVRGADKNPGAVILSPKQNAKVDNRADLFGKVQVRGWPIVLVRADQPGAMWWVQKSFEATKPGHFKVNARFGNERTRHGTPFRAAVIVAPSKEEAEKYPAGMSMKDLPAELPRSAETKVVLQRKEESVELADVITSPTADDRVGRTHEVHGKVEDDCLPVVMVRAAEANSLWWVQKPAAIDSEGAFKAGARFGNDKTPSGTQFLTVILMPKDNQADQFKPGAAFKKLPDDVPRSRQVRVVLEKGDAPTTAAAEVSSAPSG